MTRTNALVIITVLFTLGIAGTIAAILSAGSGTGRLAPRFAELPGGFDPLPAFESTSGELEFRGAECRFPVEDRYELYRECPLTPGQQ
jgi:hypothetical protein